MAPITVALDWTPNTNHIGFYVAKAKGWYTEAGLDVTILSTHHDDYKRTPASRVVDGSAQFAVTPTESVISSHTQPAGGDAVSKRISSMQQTVSKDMQALLTDERRAAPAASPSPEGQPC